MSHTLARAGLIAEDAVGENATRAPGLPALARREAPASVAATAATAAASGGGTALPTSRACLR